MVGVTLGEREGEEEALGLGEVLSNRPLEDTLAVECGSLRAGSGRRRRRGGGEGVGERVQ